MFNALVFLLPIIGLHGPDLVSEQNVTIEFSSNFEYSDSTDIVWRIQARRGKPTGAFDPSSVT